MSIHIIVHLFAVNGSTEGMKAYEDKSLRIFRKHGGEIVAAFKPDLNLEGKSNPDEIQVLKIHSMEAFKKFLNDPERTGLSDERDRVIAKTEMFISKADVPYPF